VLTYQLRKLKDKETLAELGLKEDSFLSMFAISKMLSICVKTNKTDEIWFNIKSTSTIERIKEILYEKTGVPSYMQMLTFESK